jgi:alpha-glucosidase (family GH31 glycosyl hydrolase)
MIRHRPFGSEHPYLFTDDQRVPPQPVAGEAIELRVLAPERVRAISCEWESGGLKEVFELARRPAGGPLTTGAEGGAAGTHLAAAAGRTGGSGIAWSVVVPPMGPGETARYRFYGTTEAGAPTRTRWSTVKSAAWQDHGGFLQVVGDDGVVPGTTRWLVDAEGCRRVRFALPLDAGEHVVGFGERYDRQDQRGHILDSVVFEQYKGQAATGRTYLPMPFAHVIGGRGWGFHVRTNRRAWFDVGASDPGRLWVEADLGGGPGETITVEIFAGHPEEVLAGFLERVGRPCPLPDWVHRLWASSNEWNTQRQVLEEIDRHTEEDIPVGVVVIEAWSDEQTFVAFRDARYEVHADGSPHRLDDFSFPADGAWPDPKAMVDQLHGRDVRLVLWQIPLQRMRPHPIGQARADAGSMIANGYCVREGDGRPYRNRGWWFPLALMPDLTSGEARAWWLSKRRYLVEELGVDGFKTDGGEHAWGHDLRYANGMRGDEGNNVFPVHYAAAYGELLESCGRAPVTFSRSGYAGTQAHGCIWAGDEDSTWDGFRASITAGLTAGACGITYWGWDLAGFSGEIPDSELYLRATAAACFSPIMQYHSEFNFHRRPSRDRTPWNIAERHHEPAVLEVFRSFAHLRERLVPYLSEQTKSGIERGLPLMRSLALVFPEDPEIWDHPYQFMLGDAILVAPVTQPNPGTWTAHLPAGHWIDVWTGQESEGPREVSCEAALDRIPAWSTRQAWDQLSQIFAR